MATQIQPSGNNKLDAIIVRATVILRIPDMDTTEMTELYKTLREITAKFGGEFDVTTAEQTPNR